MSNIVILCVEDEPEVREAVRRDLAPFAAAFRIECAEDVEDAREVIEECAARGDLIGLALCDHMLPGTTGVDLLVEMASKPGTAATRKVLLTGQAGHEDTIKAVNHADLHHYVAKPWTAEELHAVVRAELTEFVLAAEVDVMPYVATLDGARLLGSLSTPHSD